MFALFLAMTLSAYEVYNTLRSSNLQFLWKEISVEVQMATVLIYSLAQWDKYEYSM